MPTTTSAQVLQLRKQKDAAYNSYRELSSAFSKAFGELMRRRSREQLPDRVSTHDDGDTVDVFVDGILAGSMQKMFHRAGAGYEYLVSDTDTGGACAYEFKRAVWAILDCAGKSGELDQ